jgi:hypothetical protein
MTNIKVITDKNGIEQVIIDNGDEQFTSMSKEAYDKQQAEQSTPNLPGNADKL